MSILPRFVFVLLVSFILSANLHAQNSVAIPPGVTKVTSVEGITEYRLANGLRALLLPDSSKPTITVNMVYQVGSRHENYGETGMAHLLEHLMFKGTPTFPQIDQEFNKRGARSNGTTWLDRTNYFETMQASDDNLRWAIELESDRMVNSFIAQKDLDSEMTVVRNEFEMGENIPQRVLFKRLQSVAYDWHSYGRATIGNRSDIEHVKIENLQAFYRLYYQPDNAVLIISGHFDEQKALQWIAEYGGRIPKPTRRLPELWTVEPTQDGERQFSVRRAGAAQLVVLAYKTPSELHLDSAALKLGNFILADTPSGRLYKALVDSGLATEVFSTEFGGVDPGLSIFGAVVKQGESLEKVRDTMVRVVEEFAQNPPSQQELARAQLAFANEFEQLINDHERISIALSESVALGDWRLLFLQRDQLAAVSSSAVSKTAQAYYRRDNRTVGLFIPENAPQRAQIPETPTPAEVLRGFKPQPTQATVQAFDPAPNNIDARTTRQTLDGLQVAWLPKQTRGNTVQVALRLRWGNENNLFNKATIAAVTNQMLTRGTNRLTRTQIADEMERLKMSGDIWNYQTTRANLAESLKLVAHLLKDATFPQNEFDQLIKQSLTDLEEQKTDPQSQARAWLEKHFNLYPKGDVRYAMSLDERIAALQTLERAQLVEFHRQFYGASQGELAIVGDFDPARARDQIQQLFGNWKSAMAYAPVERTYALVPAQNKTIDTPDKENAVLLARINVDLRDDDSDYPALFLANYIFGGGAGLNSRLSERVRQQAGLSYSVGSQLAVNSTNRAGFWRVGAIAAPQNIAQVSKLIKDEIQRALTHGFSADEIARAKSGLLQLRQQARAQDSQVASTWLGYLYLGRTFAFSQAFDDQIAQLSAEQVNAALRKHIRLAELTVVSAGDQTKMQEASN